MLKWVGRSLRNESTFFFTEVDRAGRPKNISTFFFYRSGPGRSPEKYFNFFLRGGRGSVSWVCHGQFYIETILSFIL